MPARALITWRFSDWCRRMIRLWGRMRGLINPMLAYYWSNTGRELDINVSAWNLSMSSPAQIAVYAATHPNPDLRKLWHKVTADLAEINPGVLAADCEPADAEPNRPSRKRHGWPSRSKILEEARPA